jgi:hypothetical protein
MKFFLKCDIGGDAFLPFDVTTRLLLAALKFLIDETWSFLFYG